MKRAFLIIVVLAGFCGPSAVRADRIVPPIWTFSSAPSTGLVPPASDPGPSVVLQGNSHLRVGNGTITGADFFTYDNSSQATAITPTAFSDTLLIRDLASGETGSATFNFQLSGSVSSKAAYLSVVPTGPTTQQVHIGHYIYTITTDPFQAPQNPNPYGGWLDFHVRVRHNPEPSTLLLAGLGLPVVGWARWRRRRRTRTA
jgi:hypothetical protein